MKALFIICTNKKLDLVGYNVNEYLMNNYSFVTKDYDTDLCDVKSITMGNHEYILMLTQDHVMHNTKKYIKFLKDNFSDVEVAVHVNYHEGATAPDPILSAHHVGDIMSGTYLPFNPKYATNLLVHMDRLRIENDLNSFTTESETTHFSGVVDGNDPKLLLEWPVNNIDLEIGSTKESMDNPFAVEVISKTMFEIFNDTDDNRLNIIYLGGAHFEATYTKAILNKEYPIYLSHQLCGLWLMSEGWEDNVKERLLDLINKSTIKCDALVYHEKAKKLKPILQEIGEELDIEVFKYNALKNINNSELKNLFKEE